MGVIVIDLGCASHGHSPSVERLVERFKPDVVFGFDPYPTMRERVVVDGGLTFLYRQAAAWKHDRGVVLTENGSQTRVADGYHKTAESFDLVAFLWSLPDDGIVVKMDIEGAEYELLPWLHEFGADRRIALLLIEWHGAERVAVECPVEEWR